jgi:hypothetical protein
MPEMTAAERFALVAALRQGAAGYGSAADKMRGKDTKQCALWADRARETYQLATRIERAETIVITD